MSFFQKVFGHKAKKTPTLPEAISRLKETEEVLLKKQTHLEEKINSEVATVRKNASTNKKAAYQAIRKKRRYERQLQHVDGALVKLEAQREVLEEANTNALAVASMDKASKALKAVHKDIDVDKVDKILDDLVEQREITDNIAEVISHPVSFDEDFDEEELAKELEELGKELEDVNIDKLLPSVPQQNVKTGDGDKKKEKGKEVLAAP